MNLHRLPNNLPLPNPRLPPPLPPNSNLPLPILALILTLHTRDIHLLPRTARSQIVGMHSRPFLIALFGLLFQMLLLHLGTEFQNVGTDEGVGADDDYEAQPVLGRHLAEGFGGVSGEVFFPGGEGRGGFLVEVF